MRRISEGDKAVAIPDMTTRADEVDDPMLLLARVGYRTYQIFRSTPGSAPKVADADMTADLDRLAELFNPHDSPPDAG